MKFRTDFVTNSSSSGFVCFHVENRKLFDYLKNLGLRFENTEDGLFTNKTHVILPSGESRAMVDNRDPSDYPYVSECASISAWLVAVLLYEIYEFNWEEEEYSPFTRELIGLLNAADITHMDWAAVLGWSRDQLLPDLEEKFGPMDAAIGQAEIEHTSGFEGELGQCAFVQVHDGQRSLIDLRDLGNLPEDAWEEAWKVTYSGGLRDFVVDNGVQPVQMQAWKDGKWE